MNFKNIIVIIVFLLLSAGEALPSTYYVKTDGNDDLDGKSDATAWRTIGKVNSHKFNTGDDIYFKCGDVWKGNFINVDWTGTSADRVTIGAYFGSGTIGVYGEKPIIDGNNTAPSHHTYALIFSSGRDYITAENFRLINSNGHGVRFVTGADNCTVRNIDCENMSMSGIGWYTSKNGLVENCSVTLAGMGYKRGEFKDWPFSIGGSQDCNNITIRGCKIYKVYTEAIGLFKNTDNCLVENNIIYSAQKWGIYIDGGQNNTIRYNLVYGTTDDDFHRGNNMCGPGIGVADEGLVEYRSKSNKIYGNYIAYVGAGIWLGAPQGYQVTDTLVYNNTVIDCYYGIMLTYYFANTSIKNNIFWNPSGGKTVLKYGNDYSGINANHNLWGEKIPSELMGPDDIIGAPLIQKTSGWHSLAGGDLKLSDFSLTNSSLALNAGENLGTDYDLIVDANTQQTALYFSSTMLKTEKSITMTPYKQSEHGAGWEIGADIFLESSNGSTKPSTPENLRIQFY